MDRDDGIRSRSGVVVCLRDMGNGRSRLFFDDVKSESSERDKPWLYDVFYTFSPEFRNEDIDAMKLSPEEFQRIGEAVAARLLALERRCT